MRWCLMFEAVANPPTHRRVGELFHVEKDEEKKEGEVRDERGDVGGRGAPLIYPRGVFTI